MIAGWWVWPIAAVLYVCFRLYEVTDPDTGAQVPADNMFRAYTKAFIPRLLKHGGHPALGAARSAATSMPGWWIPIRVGALSDSPDTVRGAT